MIGDEIEEDLEATIYLIDKNKEACNKMGNMRYMGRVDKSLGRRNGGRRRTSWTPGADGIPSRRSGSSTINTWATRRKAYVGIGEVTRRIENNESDKVRWAVRLG